MNLRTANTRRRRRERLSQWSGIWEITWAYEAAEAARASGFTGLAPRWTVPSSPPVMGSITASLVDKITG